MRVQLLGPVRAWRKEQELALGPPRQRALLAMLAMRGGQPVGRDELIDGVWGSDPPQMVVNCVHSYVARLRLVLEPERAARARNSVLASAGSGYVLRLEPGHLDAAVFAGHLRQARELQAAGEPARAAVSLDAALGLWCGTPFARVPGPFADAERVRLTEEYLTAAEDHAELMLAAGGHVQAIGHLARLVIEHPFRERLVGLQMLALFRGGRQAEALAAYQRARRLLVDELGVEPGLELQRIHDHILANRKAGRPVVTDPGRGAPATPRQLPSPIPHFTGRRAELRRLADLAEKAAGVAGWTVISVISGTSGVGKTALAVRLAHDVADWFPDGQLYVNLHGFDPCGKPMQPASAIRGFLRALAVPSRQIPSGLDQQSAMYRSVLAAKRVLVILDNARDEAQVRPLLPGSQGCLVIVTSRRRLTGLAVAAGAHELTLGLFSPQEGRKLLARRLGAERLAAEPRAGADLVKLCAGLPLAVSVVAARAAAFPTAGLAALADELRDAQTRLDAFDTREVASSVRASFARSYQDLSLPAAQMFRLLGLHPGPDISVPAAASMAGVPADQARAALAELAGLNLATEHVPGRYTCHDLLRAYAAEQTIALDTEPWRRAAVHRMLDHYLHTARRGAVLLHQARDEVTPAPPLTGVVAEQLAGHRQALAWYGAEHPVLLASVELAAKARFDVHAWQLPWALVPYLFRQGHWHEWIAVQICALAAAERLADQYAQARALLDLGYAHAVTAHHGDAKCHIRHALRLFGRLGDQTGQARAYNALAMVLEGQHRYAEALGCAERSQELYGGAGNAAAKANALRTVGWFHALLSHDEQAISCCRQAIEANRKLGNLHGEAGAWMAMGYALHHLGRDYEAIACYLRSLTHYRELGDLAHQAETLSALGAAQHAAGDRQATREAWQNALDILEALQHPDAGQLRAKLARVILRVGARLGPGRAGLAGQSVCDYRLAARSETSPAIASAVSWKWSRRPR